MRISATGPLLRSADGLTIRPSTKTSDGSKRMLLIPEVNVHRVVRGVRLPYRTRRRVYAARLICASTSPGKAFASDNSRDAAPTLKLRYSKKRHACKIRFSTCRQTHSRF